MERGWNTLRVEIRVGKDPVSKTRANDETEERARNVIRPLPQQLDYSKEQRPRASGELGFEENCAGNGR